MFKVGLVAVDSGRQWLGGRYYLQHLVRCVASLPPGERARVCDVWWNERDPDDPFAEVRSLIEPPVVLRFPVSLLARLRRKFRRTILRYGGARDLFRDAGIDVLFPIPPCDSPGIPVVFWLADFNYLKVPDYFGKDQAEAWHQRVTRQVAEGTLVVVSSHQTESEFRSFLPDQAHKVRVLQFCSVPDDSWWTVEPAAAAAKHGLGDRFFVLSNQLSHHKNHRVILEALRILKDRGVDGTVVCTGSPFGFRSDPFAEEVRSFIRRWGLETRVRILGDLPRAEHIALIRRSIAMLQPSLHEGWSTPVEDAKTLGKPVLVPRIGLYEEQLGPEQAHFVENGSDPSAWADCMENALRLLPPGPDLNFESCALTCLCSRARSTGSAFILILSEALQAHRSTNQQPVARKALSPS